MNLNKRKNIISITAAIFLFLALVDGLPSGFFTLLRFIVFMAAGYMAWIAYDQKKEKWIWIFGCLVVLFNPFIIIYFSSELWRIIDGIAGVLMIISVFALKLKRKTIDLPPK